MDGKKFIKGYCKQVGYSRLKKTQYVIVSSSIRTKGDPKWDRHYIQAYNILYPPQHILMRYDDYKDEEYKDEYFEHLSESLPFFAKIIEWSLRNPKKDVIFLCGVKERKYRYLKLLKEFIELNFRVDVLEYFDGISICEYGIDDYPYAAEKCKKILKKAKKAQLQTKLESENGRRDHYSKLNKEQLIKKLKKIGMYNPNMKKSDMVDILETFG